MRLKSLRGDLTPKPSWLEFSYFARWSRDRPSGCAAQRRSRVRLPRCTRSARSSARRVQQKRPGVVTQLHELQLAEEPPPGYCSAVPPAAMRQASLPAPQRAARTRFFCLTVLLCVRGAVLQPRSTSSRRWTTTTTAPWWLIERSARSYRKEESMAEIKVRSALCAPHACSQLPGCM